MTAMRLSILPEISDAILIFLFGRITMINHWTAKRKRLENKCFNLTGKIAIEKHFLER